MLTDAAVRKAKPKDRPYKLADGGGMYLLVQPNGGRYWRMDYRFHGKRRTLSFGVYPTISLAEARDKRHDAKKLIATGDDPGHARKLEKVTRKVEAENTFKTVADEYLGKLTREGRAATTLAKKEWLLEFAHADLGTRPISQITAPELLLTLRKVEARGHYETTRRLRSVCREVFRYAIATGRAEHDPSFDLRGALTAPTTTHHAAITKPAAIGQLLRAIDGYDGHPITTTALKLAALTFVRPGELRHAEWSEFDFNNAQWLIQAERMKMRRPHVVPLAQQTIAALEELKPNTGRGRYVFPSLRSSVRPMSENTINAALRRLGYSKDEMTGHGFRSMAATRLNEMGTWNPDAIERQLAHQEANAVRRAYTAQAEYLDERRTMMQAWADYLDELRRG
jgi:integrase